MLLEHERGGHHDAPELCKRRCNEPELVMATQDDHNEITAADAVRCEHVRRLVRPAFHVGECEYVLLAFRIAPDHGTAIGVVDGDIVDDVVAEVEIVGVFHGKREEASVGIIGFPCVFLVEVSHCLLFRDGRGLET